MKTVQTLLPTSELPATAHRLSDRFRSAEPFPHAVVDGLFDHDSLQAAEEAFPEPGGGGLAWQQFDNDHEKKWASADIGAMPDPCRAVLEAMVSDEFTTFLSILTGISGLEPDLAYFGGGLHVIEPGGLLDVHVDFNRHSVGGREMWRRLNVLLFVNPAWRDGWAGHLELWRDPETCAERVAPTFNRLAVFATSAKSWHGHPRPLACPGHIRRRSFAAYFYAPHPAQDDTTDPRGTTWAS